MEVLDFAKHRYPFLLIDKVLEYEYMSYATCIKNVSFNEPWVQGHYPEKAIYPGVLLLESMAQASGPMLMKDGKRNESVTGFLTQIDRVKFIRPVFPGDQVILQSKMEGNVNRYYITRCEAFVDGKKVASAKMSYYIETGRDND